MSSGLFPLRRLVVPSACALTALAAASILVPSDAQAQQTLSATASSQPAPAVDPMLYDGMRYRMVGPFRGGRTTAVTGIADRPHTFFFGGAGGGVWKTEDAGHHWTPIADDFLTAGAVGALDVADSDPDVLYVGTGSACIRGNVSVGRGVWRTRDGGDHWDFVGLPKSGAVGSLIVHPDDPDLVYVAALGSPFGKNPERGVYRSRDGGDTWDNVLFLNDSTGAVSLDMSPRDPDVLYAGMWRAERKPWTLISGGMEGGLYKTTDGGDSWTKLGGGLPEGLVGKVTVSVSRANPDRVYAMVEAEPGNGLYRSDDAGETWTFVNGEGRLTGRAFYYHHVHADPEDEDTVYVLNTRFYRSTDGGETFELIPVHHGDVHDLWINPTNADFFVVGDDGGAEVSLNGGETLSGVYNQPTAELYDVMVDNGYPYRLYGSQQDNTTISVPAFRGNNNLRPQEGWDYAAGCEVGPIAFDPDDPSVIWSGCYGGIINRWDRTTDVRRNLNLYPENQGRAPKDLQNRFQWIAPIVMDPLDPATVYHASQYLHRTRDGGQTWETISPDLTTDTPEHQETPGGPIHTDHTGVEMFNTIFAVAPSPHARGTIWVGSDDGRVHITRDDGATWTDITPSEMPRFGTVNRIEISPHRAGRAFLAVQRYREDDWRPYVFRTDDFGANWALLTDGTNGIPEDYWVRVVREDDVREGLLYAGTEFGLFVSFDDGARWQPLQMNLPASPIMDLKVAHGDLAVATQGRSFWVLDDLTPLRELAGDLAVEAPALLYTPRDIARGRAAPPLQEMDLNVPDPLPDGALLHYAIQGEAGPLSLEVVAADGRVMQRWASPDAAAGGGGPGAGRGGGLSTDPGFHRVVWRLRDQGSGNAKVPPGSYTARLTWDGGEAERPFQVLPDPLNPTITQADYEAQYRITGEVAATAAEIRALLRRIGAARDEAIEIVAAARAADRDVGRLPELLQQMEADVAPLEARLDPPDRPDVPVSEVPATGAGLVSDYGTLVGYLNSGGGYGAGGAEGAPTAGGLARRADLDAAWAEVRDALVPALEQAIERFNHEASRLELEGIGGGS
ncbi:MAG: glycosyl hydrolase [Gemmatimonadetes bacterium]|nr:glycosyl hydrolase [Gemmatimonadota bacterium]